MSATSTGSRGGRLVARVVPGEPGIAVAVPVQLTFGAVLVLTVVAVFALATQTIPRQELAFALCFGVCLPIAFLLGWREAAALTACHRPAVVSALVGLAGLGALVVILAARLAHAFGVRAAPVLLGGLAVWALIVAVAWRSPGGRERLGEAIAGRPRAASVVLTAVGILVVVALLPPGSLRPGPLALSLLALALVLPIASRWPKRSARGRLVHALDVLVVGAIVLLVVDVQGYLQYLPYDPYALLRSAGRAPASLLSLPSAQAFLQQLHQDFFLAPVNDVLHGRPVLVDTYTQYGTGAFYFLAVWFKLAPLGYGALGLLSGLMTGLQYACGYAILRVAGCRPAVAMVALGTALTALVLGAFGSLTQYPAMGGLRFLWAYLLILLVVAGVRWPAWSARARVAALAILCVSAAWSLETMVYGLAIVSAAAGFAALSSPELPGRWRRLGVDLAVAVGCCAGANLALTLVTLASSGQWPDWRPYLAFFTAYGEGDVKTLNSPLIHSWSAGFGAGAVYFASALGLVTTTLRRSDFVRERRATFAAVAVCTAYGVGILTYWITHSQPNSLLAVALPAVMVAALWLGLARDPRSAVSRGVRVRALALGLWLAAVMVVFAWPEAEAKWQRSALWQAVPGTASLRDDLTRLWHSPRLDPRSAEAEALLARHTPGHGPVAVLMEPDLTVETLVRAHRVNALPLGDILQDTLIRSYVQPRLNRAIDRLRPGTLVLAQLQPDPRIAPLEGLAPLLQSALARLRERFALQVVATSPSGLSMVRLAPARAHGTG